MTSTISCSDFLPGRFVVQAGAAPDYRALQHYHYATGPPATWAGVWVIRYLAPGQSRTAAVGVLSWPVLSCRARERWFGLRGPREKTIQFINRHLRTISRIVVHPQFRGIGLSTILVRHLCQNCPTRHVEAIARMGHVHPLFVRAGMRFVNPGELDEPGYFIFDRNQSIRIAPEAAINPALLKRAA